MLQKTEIKGHFFIQVDVFGCYLPSHASIEYALSQFKNRKRKEEFCNRSNSVVREFSPSYDIPMNRLNLDKYYEFHEDAKREDSWKEIQIAELNKGITINIAAR
jgi:hypothetical protein